MLAALSYSMPPTQTFFDEPVNGTGIKYLYCISANGLEVCIDTPIDGKITEPSHFHGVASPNASGLFSIQYTSNSHQL